MLRGFYAATAGMISQQRRTEMLTNNLANANTPGFKADQGSLRSFPEMLISRLNSTELPNNKRIPNHQPIGELNTSVYLQETIPKFLQGDLQNTGNKTDLALLDMNAPINEETNKKGSFFFTVQNGEGDIRYTRNGNFSQDGNGNLTTTEGYYILNTEGNPIQLNGNEFTVDENGVVFEEGTQVAQLDIALADNPNNLVKEGNGLFRLVLENEMDGDQQEPPVLPSAINNPNVQFAVKQGHIERSNVDLQKTMTDMTASYRLFEANQKVIQAYDRSMEKAVNEIGRLR